jgi:hypothetical protein
MFCLIAMGYVALSFGCAATGAIGSADSLGGWLAQHPEVTTVVPKARNQRSGSASDPGAAGGSPARLGPEDLVEKANTGLGASARRTGNQDRQ